MLSFCLQTRPVVIELLLRLVWLFMRLVSHIEFHLEEHEQSANLEQRGRTHGYEELVA